MHIRGRLEMRHTGWILACNCKKKKKNLIFELIHKLTSNYHFVGIILQSIICKSSNRHRSKNVFTCSFSWTEFSKKQNQVITTIPSIILCLKWDKIFPNIYQFKYTKCMKSFLAFLRWQYSSSSPTKKSCIASILFQ